MSWNGPVPDSAHRLRPLPPDISEIGSLTLSARDCAHAQDTADSPEKQADTDLQRACSEKVVGATEVEAAQKDETTAVEGAKQEDTTLEGTATKVAKEGGTKAGASPPADKIGPAPKETSKPAVEPAPKETSKSVEGEPVEGKPTQMQKSKPSLSNADNVPKSSSERLSDSSDDRAAR